MKVQYQSDESHTQEDKLLENNRWIVDEDIEVIEELDEISLDEIQEDRGSQYLDVATDATPATKNKLVSIVEESTVLDAETALQQQLFSTMIAQLQLARKYMDSQEYEFLIQEHLHEGLSAHDYYSFSSLLIEHYISNREREKLKDLLLYLQAQFSLYPILEMEIQYLYDRYCKPFE